MEIDDEFGKVIGLFPIEMMSDIGDDGVIGKGGVGHVLDSGGTKIRTDVVSLAVDESGGHCDAVQSGQQRVAPSCSGEELHEGDVAGSGEDL